MISIGRASFPAPWMITCGVVIGNGLKFSRSVEGEVRNTRIRGVPTLTAKKLPKNGKGGLSSRGGEPRSHCEARGGAVWRVASRLCLPSRLGWCRCRCFPDSLAQRGQTGLGDAAEFHRERSACRGVAAGELRAQHAANHHDARSHVCLDLRGLFGC